LMGCLVAVPCALVGCLLYLRRMSMMADALSHTALPGLLLGWLITGRVSGPALLMGALFSAVVTTSLIGLVQRVPGVRRDAAIGIVFPVLFSLGLVGISTVGRGAHLDVECILFGNVLGVEDSSIYGMAGVLGLLVLALGMFWRPLAFATFDNAAARLAGLSVGTIQQGVLLAAALVTVGSFDAVGTVPTLGLMTIPAASAHRLARSFPAMLVASSCLAVFAVGLGLLASVMFDLTPTGTMVVAAALLHGVVMVVTSRTATPRPCPSV
jgi:manganese/zinc/iron transport system permease protein